MARPKNGKIEKISVVDQVGEALKEKILSGELKPGDKLPSESEIAATYGVNRLSVRMALQKLITLGIIETRVGEGSFVKTFSFSRVLNETVEFVAGGNHSEDVAELRYLIERASALKASEVCNQQAGEELRKILSAYCEAYDAYEANPCEETGKNYLDSDFELHAMIVHMSGNILYEEIYQMVQKLIRMHITELFNERIKVKYEDTNNYKELHIDLCEAILSKDRTAIKDSLNRLLNVSSAEEYLYGIS